MNTEMRITNPQWSEWDSEDTIVQRQNSSTANERRNVTSNNTLIDVNKDDSEKYEKTKLRSIYILPQCCLSMSPCFQGLILGFLTASLLFIVVLALWLASFYTTPTTNSITTKISTATATTVTLTTITTASETTPTTSTSSSTSTSHTSSTSSITSTSATSTSSTTSSTSSSSTSSISSTSSTSETSTSSSTSATTSTTVTTTTVSTTSTTLTTSVTSSTITQTTSTTTSTTSTRSTTSTTSTPSCSITPASSLALRSGPTTPWTLYSYNHTAVATTLTLVFGFSGSSADYTYLDDVSVIDNNASSIQLLNNPSFENSNSTPIGWETWCQSACSSGNAGEIITNTSCYSGNCYMAHCQPDYDYLAQSFSGTVGHNYTISFRLYQTGGGACRLYANIQG